MIPYRDCLINERQEFVVPFLVKMQDLMERNGMCTTVICDNGSQDDIQELVSKYNRIHYLYVEPNEGQYLNISKCLNKATFLTNNPLIAPLGIDFFFGIETVKYTIDFFRALGRIILRPDLVYYDKEGNIEKRTNVPYVIHKDDIMAAGGWDERMYNWGKEEDDLILRLRATRDMIEVIVKGFGYAHMWHDRSFSEMAEVEQGHNWEIMKDNMRHGGKNLLNSFWSIHDD
jgi:hypothetical protein